MKLFLNLGKYIRFVIVSVLSTKTAFAQDEDRGVEFDISIDNGAFYTQLWFWVVAGLVFLLLLIALLRGGGKKKKKLDAK